MDWPDGLKNGNEGGMWVYALWLADHSLKERRDVSLDELMSGTPPMDALTRQDPFVKCCGPDTTIALPLPDFVISSNEEDVYPSDRRPSYAPPQAGDSPDRLRYLEWAQNAGVCVLAAVCLGTTGASWYNEHTGVYWECTLNDLNAQGRRIVRSLSQLYAREATLVTYLDT